MRRPGPSPPSTHRGPPSSRPRALASGGLILVAGLALGACEAPGGDPGEAEGDAPAVSALEDLPEGTRRMVERLAALEDPYEVSSRLAELRAVEPPSELRGALIYRLNLARLQLRAGRAEEALGTLGEIRDILSTSPQTPPRAFLHDVLHLTAISYLWLGFERNCIEGTTVRCLFPTPPRGVWTEAADARQAIPGYRLLLEWRADDGLARWLLNLAHMVLGLHPDGVPERWLIPPSAFGDDAELAPFRELGAELGVDVPGHAGGSIMDDLDGDGDLDLLASGQTFRDSLRYFRNEANGRLVEVTREAGLTGLVGGLNLIHADYDNDGDPDIFVLRGGWTHGGQPNSLLRNEGNGTFTDVTEEAGVFSVHPTQTAAWADFDGDGWLDLFIGNESETSSDSRRIHPSELYRNDGDGTFTEVAAEVGLDAVGFVKSVIWGDYDNDGDPDLYVSRLGEPNRLFRNDGPGPDGRWRFTDVAEAAGVAAPVESFPAWFFDYDNDGWLDLFVSGYRLRVSDVAVEYLGEPERGALPRLYRNRGDGTFADATREADLERVLLTMGSNFGDLDNDGWLDFYIGTGTPDSRSLVPNRMFRNDGGRRFGEVTASGGFGHLGKGHGVAFGDLDNDGDQDLYVVMGGAEEGDVSRNVLWENPGFGNAWITLRLVGVESNRSAIGARIRALVELEEGGTREIHHLVGTGGSFGSNSLQTEIGLGRARAIRELEVWWPTSGRRDVYGDVRPNRVLRIREGAPEPEEVPVRPFRLAP